MKVRQSVLLLAAAAVALTATDAARCTAKTPTVTAATTTEAPIVATETPSVIVDDASEEVGAEEDEDEYPSAAASTGASAWGPGDTWDNESSYASTTSSTAASSTWDADSSYTSTTSSTASSSNTDYSSTTSSTASSTASSAAASTAASSDVESDASTASSASTSTSTSTSTSSGDHGTFGTVSSASGECVVGDPAEYITTSDVDWIYENRMKTDVEASKALITDQLQANNGTLNYCIRWDSTDSLSKATASKFQAALERQYKAWNYWLIGYDCWPFEEIKINMVGVAVKDASLLDWTDDSLGKIYVGDLDSDGVPQCPDTCYKHLDGTTTSDVSSCEGTPFDMSLWPTKGLDGGFGSWWGQQVGQENFLDELDSESVHILAHEIGHGFGLPDFYEESEAPNGLAALPACIMQAGRSMTVTAGDGWMLRRVYEHVKSRYD